MSLTQSMCRVHSCFQGAIIAPTLTHLDRTSEGRGCDPLANWSLNTFFKKKKKKINNQVNPSRGQISSCNYDRVQRQRGILCAEVAFEALWVNQ